MNECNICHKIFNKPYDYKRHMGKKCFVADVCQLQKSNIEDTIQCKYCLKKFDKVYNLKRHLNNSKMSCFYMNNMNPTIINNLNDNRIINNGVINNISVDNHSTIVNNVIIAKHGEETISHITKEVMLEILNIESFPKMCTELMRLLYFNKEVPENQNWAIVYPKNKNAGIEFNDTTNKFERKSTYDIIDDKFSNMVSLLFDLVQEISRDDIENDNLSKRQKINVNKYCMHYGQLNISKTSKDVYQSIHSLAYDSRKTQMEVWKDNGHSGNHLSLKF